MRGTRSRPGCHDHARTNVATCGRVVQEQGQAGLAAATLEETEALLASIGLTSAFSNLRG